MSRIITPFATGSVLSPEQGGTGFDAEALVLGQLLGALDSLTLGAITLIAGSGVAIDTSVPGQITLSSGGAIGVAANIVTKVADYAALITDYTILVDATIGNIVITIPQLNMSIWNIKKIDASVHTVTITPASGTIDGAANVVIANQYADYTVQSNGVNAFIL